MGGSETDPEATPATLEQIAAELKRTAAALTELANKLAGQPGIIAEGKTPREWVDLFAARGIEVSERTLRERARALGAFRFLGHAILMTPEHIDRVWEQPAPTVRKTTEESGRELLADDEHRKTLERLTRIATAGAGEKPARQKRGRTK